MGALVPWEWDRTGLPSAVDLPPLLGLSRLWVCLVNPRPWEQASTGSHRSKEGKEIQKTRSFYKTLHRGKLRLKVGHSS